MKTVFICSRTAPAKSQKEVYVNEGYKTDVQYDETSAVLPKDAALTSRL